jgi:WLM domain
VEVFNDAYRPDVARCLLARVARHVNPILRARGWRVKRLLESCSTTFLGCCYTNGRADADAASTNIKLNLRVVPNKSCRQFYSFSHVLSVMLHEITHTSVR